MPPQSNVTPVERFPRLWDELSKGELRPVYVLYGSRDQREAVHVQFLIDRSVSALRSRFAGDPSARFNQDVFQGGQAGLDQVIGAARTVPMFGDTRLTIVVDQPEPSGEEVDALAAYIRDPVPTTVLMVVFAAGKVSRKIHNACRPSGCLYKAERLKERELVRWIDVRFAQHGLRTEPGVARTLAEYTGTDLTAIEDTVEKLVIYTAGRDAVSNDDVEQCVLAVRQSEIFDLMDSIGERNAGKALAVLHRLAVQRTEGLVINAMLTRQIRNLIRIRSLGRRAPRRDELAQDLGVHPFVAQKLLSQVRNFTMRDLERALAASVEFNVRSKRSRVHQHRLMEDMVLTIIAGR